jgi:hypothetical protein
LLHGLEGVGKTTFAAAFPDPVFLQIEDGTADVIGFLATDIAVKNEDAGFGKKRVRADGGALRHLHFEARPAFTAKNRYALPAKMPVPIDFDFASKLAPLLPSAAPGEAIPIRAAERMQA